MPVQQWDLNTGQGVRNFTAHGAQLAAVAVRPQNSGYSDSGVPGLARTDPHTSDLGQEAQGHLDSTQDTMSGSTNP